MTALLRLCCAMLLALPLLAGAGESDHDRALRALSAGEIMPLRQVLELVEQRYPGQILEVELEQERDPSGDKEQRRWAYEIKLLRSDGAVTKLHLDARDGRLLRIKGRGGEHSGEGH